MYQSKFEPIKLLPITEEAKKKLKKLPGRTEYDIPFPLSATPPIGWEPIFKSRWEQIGGGVNVWLEGATLHLTCDLENVATVVKVIKQAIDAANKSTQYKIDEELRRQEEGRKRLGEERANELRAINEALDKIDYS